MSESTSPVLQHTKTILLLSEYGVLNGGEFSLLAVLRLIQRSSGSDWRFVAAVPEGSGLESELASLQIENVGLSLCDAYGVRLSQDDIRSLLADVIAKVGPDLVHCNSLAMSRLMGPVAKRLAIPAVGYLRDIYRLSKKAMSDMSQIDRLVAVSDATKRFHVGQGLDESQVTVIHNGVDSQAFFPLRNDPEPDSSPNARMRAERLRAELGLTTERVLLFVGQIGMRKGVDLVLKVFYELSEHYPDLQLVLIGQRNSAKQEAIDFEAQLHLDCVEVADRVHWLSRRSDVADWMRVATALLHPARQEPLGRVLLEAAASGLPIVSTDVGGTREILGGPLSSQFTGGNDDADALLQAISRVLDEETLRCELGDELRQIAIDRFSVEQCASQLAAVYRTLALATPNLSDG